MAIFRLVSWRYLVLRLHLFIALVLGLPLIVLGLSGSALVLHHELLGWSAPRGEVGEPRSLSQVIAAAQTATPQSFAPSLYYAPPREGDAAVIRFSGPRGSRLVKIDPVALKILPDEPSSPLLEPLHRLHETLMLRTSRVVGWLGVAMLLLGGSGLVNWVSWRGSWRQGFVAQMEGSAGLYRRLHATVGIWALIVLLFVSASGVALAFSQTFIKAVDRVSPLNDLRAASRPVRLEPIPSVEPMPIDDCVALAAATMPGARLERVVLPLRPDQPMRVSLLRTGQGEGVPTVNVLIDPWTRRIVQIEDPHTYTLSARLVIWQHAIHSGEGMGIIWNTLLFLTGLLPLFLVITGVAMWWLQRRKMATGASRGRPKRNLEQADR